MWIPESDVYNLLVSCIDSFKELLIYLISKNIRGIVTVEIIVVSKRALAANSLCFL